MLLNAYLGLTDYTGALDLLLSDAFFSYHVGLSGLALFKSVSPQSSVSFCFPRHRRGSALIAGCVSGPGCIAYKVHLSYGVLLFPARLVAGVL